VWHKGNSADTNRRREDRLMKLSKVKQFKIGRSYLSLGYNFRGIGIGFGLNKYTFDLDLVFFWISWEF
jgi:hypothetical protein